VNPGGSCANIHALAWAFQQAMEMQMKRRAREGGRRCCALKGLRRPR